MTNKQKKILLELQRKKEENPIDHPFDILIHSVLNTIDINDVIKVYIDGSLVELKSSMFSNIEKRLKIYKKSEKAYENLKSILEMGVDYNTSQRIRKVLEKLIIKLDNDYKHDFFKTFFYSKYSNDKKSAINYLTYSKNEIHEELLNEYLKSGDAKYLQPLLKKNI